MRVLQINSVCGYGSTGRITTDLYKVLEEQGHECVIAYGRGTAPEGFKTIKIGTNLDNYMHIAQTRLFDKHGFGSIKSTKEFIKKVEEYNPDIIHLHNIHGYYINIEILFEYLKRANKKVVWTLHDCWPFTGHCSYFDYAGCNKWKIKCAKCIQKKEYPKSIFVDSSKSNYEKKRKIFNGVRNLTIVTPSKWLARLVNESYLSEYNVKVINNGIDLNIFKPNENSFREKYNLKDKFIILGVANVWENRKGLRYFIELAKRLDNSYKIVIVGVNKKQLKLLPENILAIMRTNNIKELVDIYSSSNVVINPSYEETMGLITLEGLACGIPAIVSNKTAVPEVIDNSCGIIVDDENILKYINAIEHIKDLEKATSIKKSCLLRAKKFDKEKKFKEYIELYLGE